MQAIRDADIDELASMCGGCCSCATCHVYIDKEYLDILGPLSGPESDLLDALSHRSDLSRLACQIIVTSAVEGLRVTIAPEG